MSVQSSSNGSPLGLQGVALLLMVAFMWGSNNVAAHLVTQESNPLIAAGLRFVITTAILFPWLRIPRAQLRPMLLIALVAGPLHFGLLYTGFSRSHNIGALTVVGQMWVPISTILAVFVLHEKLNRRQNLGLLCAMVGILIMCFDPHLLDDLDAALFTLGATSCWAVTMVLTRRGGGLNGLSLQAWMALLTGPVLLLAGWLANPAGFADLQNVSTRYWVLTLYGAIGSGILGNAVVFNMLRKHTVVQTTPVLLSTPIFALVCGMIFLGERLGLQEMLGAALVLASVLIIVRGGRAASSA
jgi:O-acetylserine/cysteine efflux transporter